MSSQDSLRETLEKVLDITKRNLGHQTEKLHDIVPIITEALAADDARRAHGAVSVSREKGLTAAMVGQFLEGVPPRTTVVVEAEGQRAKVTSAVFIVLTGYGPCVVLE